MSIGRRSQHTAAKNMPSRTLFSRLNRREREELRAKSGVAQVGAAKAPAKTQARAPRPTYGLETIEPRLLMSADLSYTTLNDTMTLSIGGTAAAPTVKLSDGSGQLAS